jgi:hypothetical protein
VFLNRGTESSGIQTTYIFASLSRASIVYFDGFFQLGEALVEIFKVCLYIAYFGNIGRKELCQGVDNPFIVLPPSYCSVSFGHE